MLLIVWLAGICVEDKLSLDDVIAADVLILVLVPLLETTAST